MEEENEMPADDWSIAVIEDVNVPPSRILEISRDRLPFSMHEWDILPFHQQLQPRWNYFDQEDQMVPYEPTADVWNTNSQQANELNTNNNEQEDYGASEYRRLEWEADPQAFFRSQPARNFFNEQGNEIPSRSRAFPQQAGFGRPSGRNDYEQEEERCPTPYPADISRSSRPYGTPSQRRNLDLKRVLLEDLGSSDLSDCDTIDLFSETGTEVDRGDQSDNARDQFSDTGSPEFLEVILSDQSDNARDQFSVTGLPGSVQEEETNDKSDCNPRDQPSKSALPEFAEEERNNGSDNTIDLSSESTIPEVIAVEEVAGNYKSDDASDQTSETASVSNDERTVVPTEQDILVSVGRKFLENNHEINELQVMPYMGENQPPTSTTEDNDLGLDLTIEVETPASNRGGHTSRIASVRRRVTISARRRYQSRYVYKKKKKLGNSSRNIR